MSHYEDVRKHPQFSVFMGLRILVRRNRPMSNADRVEGCRTWISKQEAATKRCTTNQTQGFWGYQTVQVVGEELARRVLPLIS